MPRRNRNRIDLPKIDLPGIEQAKEKLPKIHLPQIKLPKIQIPFRQLLVLAGLVILVLVMMNLNSRLSEYYRLSTERDRLATVVGGLVTTQQVLQTQVAFANSDPAAEEYARNSHMIRQGDVLVVALTPVGNPMPTPEVTQSVPRIPQNWEIWWALFFEQ
jgi:hypothetical protein